MLGLTITTQVLDRRAMRGSQYEYRLDTETLMQIVRDSPGFDPTERAYVKSKAGDWWVNEQNLRPAGRDAE
jgi:hypothetical protein